MTVEIDYDGDPSRPTEKRPESSVVRFDGVEPSTGHASAVGCNFDHLVWEYEFPASRWFDRGQLRRLDPGVYRLPVPPGGRGGTRRAVLPRRLGGAACSERSGETNRSNASTSSPSRPARPTSSGTSAPRNCGSRRGRRSATTTCAKRRRSNRPSGRALTRSTSASWPRANG